MFHSRWYKVRYISILIILYTSVFIGSNNNALPLNSYTDNPVQHSSYILAVSHGSSTIDLNQVNRKVWVYQDTNTWARNSGGRFCVLFLLPILYILSFFIDKYKKIKELCTMRFNGTKYKGWFLLPKA